MTENPKPNRNWRDFLKEYAIIVIGVLTALAAQQAVEWWNWREQVEEARGVIASEMSRNIIYGVERLRAARCVQTRLESVEKILNAASRTGALPPLGGIGGVPTRPWSSGAWDSVVASQTATHFPRSQLAALSLVYQRVARVENWNRQEQEVWSSLRSLSGSGRRFDASTEAELRRALSLATYYNYVIAVSSDRLVQGATDQNLPFSPNETREMTKTVKNIGFWSSQCKPVNAEPSAVAPYISEQNLKGFAQSLERLPWADGRPAAKLP